MRKSTIEKVINDSNRDKRFFSALVRLKKNGRFSRVNGKVHAVRQNKQTGEMYAVVSNYAGGNGTSLSRKWQTVSIDRILQVKKDGYRYV